jgi:uncharacterized protein (TIGR02145 family)
MKRIIKQRFGLINVLLLLFFISCNNDVKPPLTGRTTVSGIFPTEATVSSKIIWDGGADIEECGFCWDTRIFPNMAGSFIRAEKIDSVFSVRLTDLLEGKKYYVRSYAVNRAGIYYGEVKGFITPAYRKPSVYSPYIISVTHNSVTCGNGEISDNSYNVLSKGVCWSTSIDPTINDQKIELGEGFGRFDCKIEGLAPGTVYYIRAYATNIVGTTYAGNLVIRTYDGSVKDYEGNVYSTVKLGKQEWMTEDLKTSHFANGDEIPTTYPVTLNTSQEANPVYQWVLNGQVDLGYYDRIYTWYAVADSRKICPTGWHLPSITEWDELLLHLGGDKLTSRDFRRIFNYYWNSFLNEGATEGSFGAELVGYRTVTGQIQYSSYGTYWWSGTESSASNADVVYCGQADFDPVFQTDKEKKNGFSIRCVKN